MNNLRLFEINDNYYKFILKFDNKIMYNKNAVEGARPYVGVVIEINNFKYFAPLSSPKSKHLKPNKKYAVDQILIEDGILGAINLNNMIPVNNCFLRLKNHKIEQGDDKDLIKYKIMLTKQIDWCNRPKYKKIIINKAERVYKIKTNKAKSDFVQKIKDRCCDFKLLEEKCKLAYNILMANKYNNVQNPSTESPSIQCK